MATRDSESDAQASDVSVAKDSSADPETGTALDEYETQYFGFTPKSFCNGFYNAVNEYFLDGLNILEEQGCQKFSDAALTNQVKEGTSTMKRILARHIDSAFDTLEAYLFNNIFCIPAHVVLPEDKVHEDAAQGPQELERLDQEVQAVKDKIMAVKYANATLQGQILDGKKVQETLSTVVEEFQQIQEQVQGAGVPNVRDYVAHNLTQAEKLLHLMGATSKLLRSQTDEDENMEPKAKMLKPS